MSEIGWIHLGLLAAYIAGVLSAAVFGAMQ